MTVKRDPSKPLIVHAWMCLSDALAALGYQTTRRGGGLQGKKVFERGRLLFEGTENQIWTWLRTTRRVI